jgi:hypothetical protein
MVSGTCNCGGVAFTLEGPLPAASACHCGQCRKQSGHVWASVPVAETALAFTAEATLTWYDSSEIAKRGFCNRCGAFLFWKHRDEAQISVAMGALDAPTGTQLGRHIFVADKGDYYDIADELPQRAQ